MITNIYKKEIKMKENKKAIKLKASQAVWALIILSAIALLVSVCYLLDLWAVEFWGRVFAISLVSVILFYEFSLRRVEIDFEERKISCKTLFIKMKSIPIDEIKEVKNAKNIFCWNLKLVDKNGVAILKIPKDIIWDNCLKMENLVNFLSKKDDGVLTLDRTLLSPDSKTQKIKSIILKIFFAVISVPFIGAMLEVFMLEMEGRPAFPIRSVEFYDYAVFWVLLVNVVIFLIAMLTNKKHYQAVDFLGVIVFLCYIPMALICMWATPEDCYVSATRDFENYYEVKADEIDYFPDEIDGEVIAFSYYYCDYWDWVHEVCLEVKYDDEEFDRIYSEYEEKEKSYFGEGLEEVHFEAKYENLELYEKEDGEVEIAHASIKLMIFDKENNTIIYYYLYSLDFLDLDRCYLVERFDIDIHDYAEYVEKSGENTN